MGALTRKQIVDEAMLMAGDTSLSKRSNVWLNAWLRSQYAAFPWPFLLRFLEGIPLVSGSSQVTLGNHVTYEPAHIRRVLNPIYVYDSLKRTRRQVNIKTATEMDISADLTMNDPATNRGLPSEARVYASTTTPGQWDVKFDKWADQNYLVKVGYYMQPADFATDATADALIPIYPNDRTLVKAVEVEILRYKKSEMATQELQVLASMTVDDRLKYGQSPGQNDYLDLDKTYFT